MGNVGLRWEPEDNPLLSPGSIGTHESKPRVAPVGDVFADARDARGDCRVVRSFKITDGRTRIRGTVVPRQLPLFRVFVPGSVGRPEGHIHVAADARVSRGAARTVIEWIGTVTTLPH